jgi:hypothetical protein
MVASNVESSAAKSIRDGWRIVCKKNDALRNVIRAGRAVKASAYDGELDQAWFESQDGTDGMVGVVRLFSFEESEQRCATLVRDPARPATITNRTIFARPVGLADRDLIALATIGRGNLYGKILRITEEQLAGIEMDENFNVVLSYDPLAVVVDSAGKWIRKTFETA